MVSKPGTKGYILLQRKGEWGGERGRDGGGGGADRQR